MNHQKGIAPLSIVAATLAFVPTADASIVSPVVFGNHATEPASGPDETHVIEVDILDAESYTTFQRRASYWIPATVTPPGGGAPAALPAGKVLPVVFAFHGGSEGEWDCANNMNLNSRVSDSLREFILVCPRPLAMTNGELGWVKHFGANSHVLERRYSDEAFIRDLVALFTTGTDIDTNGDNIADGDPARVYMVGFSGAAAFLNGFVPQNSDIVSAAVMSSGTVAGFQNGWDDELGTDGTTYSLGSPAALDSEECADPMSTCEPLPYSDVFYPNSNEADDVGPVPVMLIWADADQQKDIQGGEHWNCDKDGDESHDEGEAACNANRRLPVAYFNNSNALSTVGWWQVNNGCNPGEFEFQQQPTIGPTDYNWYVFDVNCTEVRAVTIYESDWGAGHLGHAWKTSGSAFNTNEKTLDFFELQGGLGPQ